MLKRLSLSLAGLLVGLLTAELICRWVYGPHERDMPFHAATSDAYVDDAELGWLPRPLVHGEHPVRRNPTTRFSTNSFGLRDRELELSKRPGVQRIVVVGDSFAWGWGVNDGESFADQLEASRANREVVNLGVTGFGIRQELIYFRRLGERFSPDVVVLALCENDIVGTKQDFLWRRSQAPVVEALSGFSRFKSALERASGLYRLVTDVVDSHRTLARWAVRLGIKHRLGGYDALDGSVKPFLKHYPPELAHQWETAMAQLLQFRDLLAGNGTRFVVALVPALQSVDQRALERTLASTEYDVEDFDLDRPHSALARVTHEQGLEVVDPTPAFRAAISRGDTLYLVADMHFNKAGHELFAKAIGEHLDARDVNAR